MNHKQIKINQRIPLDVLSSALVSLIEGNYNEEYILQQLRLEFNGENRLAKSIGIINKIILKNPQIKFIEEHKEELKQALTKKSDRNVILIALLNSTYSFAFDTLQFLGKYLNVQDVVSRETIKKSLGGIYGGNRSTDNAIDSVIPMFIEAGIILRPANGLYQHNPDIITSYPVSSQLYVESYRLWLNYDEIQEYHLRDPYFLFLK